MQVQETSNMDTTSLDGIHTTVAWRVEIKRSMEFIPNWSEEEATKEVVTIEERELDEEEEVTPPSMVTNRGCQSLTPTSFSRGCQSPMPAPTPSSSRGKAITFTRKWGRRNH